MLFTYTALKDGSKTSGKMEAGSEKEVADYLKKNGLFPIDISLKKDSPVNTFSTFFQRISFQDVTFMTRQFAIMLDAGLTLIDSIDIIKKQVQNVAVKNMLIDIDKGLRDGKTFSDTLTKYPKHFSHFYIALVRSGEASGKLNDILGRLSEHLEKQREFQQKIRNALIYPAVIITAMLGMIFVMFAFVLPQLLAMFKDFDVELPQMTIVLMQASGFMEANWIYVLVGIVSIVMGLLKYKSSENGKKVFDRLILKAPLFGNIVKSSGLVDGIRTLAILMSSGVPILDGLTIVIDVNSNIIFKEAFMRIKEKVEKGTSIGTAMANEPIFPESLVQMTIVGEQTGHLDTTLLKLAEYYQSESEMAVKGVLTMIEPAILVVLGLVVGFIVFAVISPIFALTASFQ